VKWLVNSDVNHQPAGLAGGCQVCKPLSRARDLLCVAGCVADDGLGILLAAAVTAPLGLPASADLLVEYAAGWAASRCDTSSPSDSAKPVATSAMTSGACHAARRHATAMCGRPLPRAHDMGIDPVLVTCDVGNLASRKVIEANRGVLEDERTACFGIGFQPISYNGTPRCGPAGTGEPGQK
jgi:hypothetical protein